ncbi:MAG TPA: dCTP deaminase [Candidatus Dojkabacteria bacterium]|nr:dCTP deaminase [Candidatus Dojkabacteria bacterium]HPP18541.1 dCTP deaminase [Candidatus Dojkabacteria bacterium]
MTEVKLRVLNMILSDKSIKEKINTGEISISPFSEDSLQPASYDLHLDKNIMYFNTNGNNIIDVKKPVDELMIRTQISDSGFVIEPHQLVLANVIEITGVDSKHVGRLEGKSSLARIGLIIHATAGFLDPGNKLRLTLEMVNLSPLPIRIYVGMKIAQIAFEELDTPCEKPYGSKSLNSKYVGDLTVQASKIWKNF